MRALLSIKPQYARSIFSGCKKFEYRRAIFKKPIDRIVVYASAPISEVIGEFDIDDIIHDNIDDLWSITSTYSGISKQFFYSYFVGKERGYAIKIGKTHLYKVPKNLWREFGVQPPQSFLYLS
jgi:predicted transcriptional regulator